MRSGLSRVTLCTVASDFRTPETTRKSVIRPANGSAIVFHTVATSGSLSWAVSVTASPAALRPETGRSLGGGT